MTNELTSFLMTQAGQVVGNVADLQAFAAELSADLIEAVSLDRQDLVKEIRSQIEVRAEKLRIEGNRHFWNTLQVAIGLTIQTAFGFAKDLEVPE